MANFLYIGGRPTELKLCSSSHCINCCREFTISSRYYLRSGSLDFMYLLDPYLGMPLAKLNSNLKAGTLCGVPSVGETAA